MLDSPLRRRLLQIIAAAALFPAWPVLARTVSSAPSAKERQALRSWLDTLLPADEYSPAASALKVDQQLWQIAEQSAPFRQLLALGCQWLNLAHPGGFSALPAFQQQQLLAWMSESGWQQPPRRFYQLVRQTAIECYYSQAAGRAGLNLPLAPQPQGYPPPWN